MKYAIPVLLIVLLLSTCNSEKTKYVHSDTEYSLFVSSNTTKLELQEISEKFKSVGLLMDYSKSEFNSNDRLIKLNLQVDYKDIHLETTANNFALMLWQYGFKIVFDENRNVILSQSGTM